MATYALLTLIAALVFAAVVYSGKTSRPAWAQTDNAELVSHYRETSCRTDRCQRLRQRMWAWYHTSGAECVRRHEGAWDDPNGPYYGGFQQSLAFQQTYGYGGRGARYYRRWGTADHWPRFRQIHSAYRGWQARGFQPWPTTGRMCGLL